MSPILYIAIVAAIILFVISIIIIYYLLQKNTKEYDGFILQNSICLKQLKEINQRYMFYPYICFDQSYTYDNEKLYDAISCDDYLIYQLQFIKKDIFDQIEKVNINRRQYSEYLNELKTITQFGQFQSSIGKLKADKLNKKERRIIKANTYGVPTTRFFLTVTLYCSKINGQIYSRKSKRFSIDDIVMFVKRLNNKNGKFYNDREIWNALCRVERGKVSNKMRFSIYERDGYRCCKCGIADRYAQLEIDHIIPIAKGGKSTYDNLQTLCHRCNVEKGDHIYY